MDEIAQMLFLIDEYSDLREVGMVVTYIQITRRNLIKVK